MKVSAKSVLVWALFGACLQAFAHDPGQALEEFGRKTSDVIQHHGNRPSAQEQAQNITTTFEYDLQTLESKHMAMSDESFVPLARKLIHQVPALVGKTRTDSVPVVGELVAYYQGISNNPGIPKDRKLRAEARLKQLRDLLAKLEG